MAGLAHANGSTEKCGLIAARLSGGWKPDERKGRGKFFGLVTAGEEGGLF